MNNTNLVVVTGNLTRDPEARQAGETTVVGFAVAVNESWKSKDGEVKERTSFFDVEAWGTLGTLVSKYLKKGSKVLVSGSLRQDVWEKEGEKRSKVYIVADTVEFLNSAKEDGPAKASAPASKPTAKPAGKPAGKPGRPAAKPASTSDEEDFAGLESL